MSMATEASAASKEKPLASSSLISSRTLTASALVASSPNSSALLSRLPRPESSLTTTRIWLPTKAGSTCW